MRIKFVYNQDAMTQRDRCSIVNADTGEPLEMAQSVSFHISAQDMVPRMVIELIPTSVEIAAAAEMHRRFAMDTPVAEVPAEVSELLGTGQIS